MPGEIHRDARTIIEELWETLEKRYALGLADPEEEALREHADILVKEYIETAKLVPEKIPGDVYTYIADLDDGRSVKFTYIGTQGWIAQSQGSHIQESVTSDDDEDMSSEPESRGDPIKRAQDAIDRIDRIQF